MKNQLLRTLLVLAISICCFSDGWANTYYVSNGGDDSRSSTQAQSVITPWQTIGFAVSQSANGDSIVVATGTYAESITVSTQLSIVGSNLLAKPRITGDGITEFIFKVSVPNVQISGLNIEVDQVLTMYGIQTAGTNVSGLMISNNEIRSGAFSGTPDCVQFPTMGVFLENIGTSSFTIKRNIIFPKTNLSCIFGRGIRVLGGQGTIGGPILADSNIIGGSYAIQVGEPRGPLVVEQNHLYGRGAQFVGPTLNSGQHIFRNNRFEAGDYARVVVLFEVRGLVESGTSLMVSNNSFKDFGFYGLLTGRSRNVTIHNNTFTPHDTNTFISVGINTKQLTDAPSNTQTAFANSAIITGNTFNKPPILSGGGANIIIYNHNDIAGNGSFSNVTVGTIAAPNTFKLGVKHNILLDTNSGPSKLFDYFENEDPTAITNMSPTVINLDITNNLFELTTGLIKPCAMNLAQQTELESRIYHLADNPNLGFITYLSLQAPTITGLAGYCPGGFTILRTNTVLLAGESFVWSDNSTADSLLVSTAGAFSVRIVNIDGCKSIESGIINTAEIALPTPTISGSTTFCNGSNTTLTTNYVLGPDETYFWSNGQTTQSILAEAGNYSLQIVNSLVGCTGNPSSTLTVFGIACPNTIVWTGGTSTDWFTVSNWTPNGTPLPTDSVIIPIGKPNYPVIAGDAHSKGLYLQVGTSLTIGTTDTLAVHNTLTLNGALLGNGVLALRGATQQLLPSANFGKLLIDNPAGVKQLGAVTIRLYVRVNRGFLDVNNQALMLRSDAISTGSLGSAHLGAFINANNVTTHRRLDPNSTQLAFGGSWTNVAPPITGLTANYWSANNPYAIHTYVGAQPINSSFWLYDGSNTTTITNNGYVKASNSSQSVPLGVGARIWFRTSTFYNSGGTLTATGAPHLGDFNWTLNYCASGCAYPIAQGGTSDNGWNLIGNPYMGPIDWEDASWVRSNVGLGTWIWRDRQQNFASYVAGVGGVNGGNNVIGHHQGFFVQALAGSPTLGVRPAAVSAAAGQAAPAFLRVGNSGKLRLTLHADTWSDEVLLVNNPSAQVDYNGAEDGKKMDNPNLNLAFMTQALAETIRTSISSYPLAQLDTIALSVRASGTTPISLSVNELSLQGKSVILWDRVSGTKQQLYANDQVSVSNDPTNSRYALIIGGMVTSLGQAHVANFSIYPNPASGSLRVRNAEAGQFRLINMIGAVVFETSLLANDQLIDVSKLPAGIYHADLNGNRVKVVIR